MTMTLEGIKKIKVIIKQSEQSHEHKSGLKYISGCQNLYFSLQNAKMLDQVLINRKLEILATSLYSTKKGSIYQPKLTKYM